VVKQVSDSPAPNAYSVAAAKESPAYSLSGRAKDLKAFATPAPGSYEVEKCDEELSKKPSLSFGIKHSPYTYSGKMKGDSWVSARTEAVANGHTNGTSNGFSEGVKIKEHVEYRQRSGTFTRDKPTVLRQTAVA